MSLYLNGTSSINSFFPFLQKKKKTKNSVVPVFECTHFGGIIYLNRKQTPAFSARLCCAWEPKVWFMNKVVSSAGTRGASLVFQKAFLTGALSPWLFIGKQNQGLMFSNVAPWNHSFSGKPNSRWQLLRWNILFQVPLSWVHTLFLSYCSTNEHHSSVVCASHSLMH